MPKCRDRGVRVSASPAVLLAVALAFLGTACPLAAAERIGTHETAGHRFHLVKVVDGLEHPWGLAFPAGRADAGDRAPGASPHRGRWCARACAGRRRSRGVGRGPGRAARRGAAPRLRGENGLIYLSYASPDDDDEAATAIARGRLADGRLKDVEEIYVALPRDDGGRHFGSRLLFADGYLFVTAGERGEPDRAQDLGDPAGSVIRLHDDGRVPDDNPFVGREDARPEIYTYGNRNPQGMALEAATGRIYAIEHGPKGGDELNLIEPGV